MCRRRQVNSTAQPNRKHSSLNPPLLRLQTGMRGAFGKPAGCVARVDIGQVLFSVRARDSAKPHVIEAMRRAKYKFPGRQKIVLSNKWGFTSLPRDQYRALKAEGRLIPDGANVKVIKAKGPLGY